MAHWIRAHVIKAAFIVLTILLILFNFYHFGSDYRLKIDSTTSISIAHPRTFSVQWAKYMRLKTSSAPMNRTEHHRETDRNDNSNASAIEEIATITISHPLISNSNGHSIRNDTNNTSSYSRITNNNNNINGNDRSKSTTKTDETSQNFNYSVNDTKTITPTTTNTPRSIETHTQMSNDNDDGGSKFLQRLMTSFGLNSCPPVPPDLIGPIVVDTNYEKLESLEVRMRDKLMPGGWFKPKECRARDRVAIVIPYRDREHHLAIFLKHMHPFLMKQQIEYGIFVIEQIVTGPFNRAALMNIGFAEALKLKNWDCFIFHDIDLLPMDDRNLYTCPDQPRHMSVAVDTLGFKLPYSSLFGGVSAMTVDQFKAVNGFSNSFWGWGGEDDDMSNRLRYVGFHIARYPVNIARYTMLTHRKERANPRRYEKLANGAKKFELEGLNSMKYKIRCIERKPLFTWILADIRQDTLMNAIVSLFS